MLKLKRFIQSLIKPKEFEGHDANMLLKKAKYLKGTDGEGHAIGLLVERLVKEDKEDEVALWI